MLRRCHFVGGGAILAGADRDDGAVSVSYVDADKANLTYPLVRDADEVLRQLKTLAKENDAYTEIVENYDDYPEELLWRWEMVSAVVF